MIQDYAFTTAGTKIKAPEEITSFRGEKWIFVGWAALPDAHSTGKVIVHPHGNPERRREFYPSVFNLTANPQ